MKKIFTLLVLGAFAFAGNVKAQCGLSLTTTASTVCTGDNVTLTANATPPVTAMSLNTTMAAGNNHRGNMFDIVAANTVTITSFDAHPMANTTIEIYYKTGTWNGFENSPASWTLIGSAAVTAQPTGTPTPVPVPINITIPAGQTYGFYVTSSNTAVSLNYTDGTAVGNVFTSDANISFLEGAGLEYPFTNGTGSTFTPRVWNGVIHYTVPQVVTYNYLWNTTETTSSINPTIASSSQYTVQVDITGCPTMFDTVNIQVSTPPVSAGADAAVCTGSSYTLSGSGAVSYTWDNSVTDGVPFTPVSTMNYIVTGTDSIGCTNNDTVMITVNNLPVVNAGADFSTCAGSQATLSGSGAVSYSWDNSVTDGVPFTPASTQTYIVTGTDANGCMNTDTTMITVNPLPVVNGGSDQAVCAGTSVTLSGSGAVTYSWDNSVTDGVTFTPASTQTYIVTGTDANGCMNTDTTTITVNTLPVVTGSASSTAACLDDAAVILTGTPAGGTWSGPGVSGSAFSPMSAGTGAQTVIYQYTDGNGCDGTDSVTITVNACTGITEATAAQNIEAYPNPSNGKLSIVTGNTIAAELSVVDYTGKIILDIIPENSQTEIDLSMFANGLYFVKITTADGIKTVKVVKN